MEFLADAHEIIVELDGTSITCTKVIIRLFEESFTVGGVLVDGIDPTECKSIKGKTHVKVEINGELKVNNYYDAIKEVDMPQGQNFIAFFLAKREEE